MKSVFLDFEYNQVTEANVNLVCCVTQEPNDLPRRWWLFQDKAAQSDLKDYLRACQRLIAYNAVAECRALISLGLDPLSFKIFDLFLEYRCLTNHNDKLSYGDQLVDGKIKKTRKPPPKWERTEEDSKTGFKPTHSLAEATFKLLGIARNVDDKDDTRLLIISNPPKFTYEERQKILDYCESDVLFLPDLYNAMLSEYKKLLPKIEAKEHFEEMHLRGRYAAHTAIMESFGYPIDLKKTKNFSQSVETIMYDCQREINELFPSISPFKWDKKSRRFRWDQKATREWIRTTQDIERWQKTDTGDLSLSLDAFGAAFHFKHDYPKDNFGAQMLRFLKLKQNLYGFVPSADKNKKNFWSSVGSDGRVRPYMNIYGAQSSRSQPASTGFMFLKPAWMRALVIPENPKMAMAGIDYGSQEFFISALMAEDENMIKAYLSGDVYLAFGKMAGMIPPEGTKETHKKERDLCKSTVLGINFGMTKIGLSAKLTQDTGRIVDEDEAQGLIDAFHEVYPDWSDMQERLANDYMDDGYLKLPCGWYLWGDNDNIRSVLNVPIQGRGATIMRKAVDNAVKEGLKISFTLHDAIYIEYPVGKEKSIELLAQSMINAFVHIWPENMHKYACQIRLEAFAWSKSYKDGQTFKFPNIEVEAGSLYLDQRAKTEYDQFSKYFETREESLL